MRLFHITHPDGVDELPLPFADEALQFERIEGEVRAEAQDRANR
jgi:hypothetical protein